MQDAVGILFFVLNHGTAVDVIIAKRCMESATRCGMESMHNVALDGIKTEGDEEIHAIA